MTKQTVKTHLSCTYLSFFICSYRRLNCLAWNIPNNTMIKQASRNGYILRNTNVCTSKLKPVKIKQLNIL